ncbi:hypothetical protein [Anaeromyxobacter oryzae]|uniref:Uncharacterized protein n=1 Tax=Anaeromyxobacter oryzae TaxID=2918170 RepID=A0ABM7WQ05_9BACT|nr:hypothetical protein [Anaeromyxobacter oryzae]BDG01551.1 hypothetical protein AMOR_05470 [Anaeromyxobacter oryzae]
MPRSILVAIIAASLVGLLGLAAFAHSVAGLTDHTGVDLFAQVVTVISLALCPAFAMFTVRGLLRRGARTRYVAFAVSFATSLVFALILLVALITLAAARPGPVDFIVPVAVVILNGAPVVAVAWSLSRPSAKTWVTSSPPVH